MLNHPTFYFKNILLTMTLSMLGMCASAQDWPTKPVKIIVPWAAGGVTDTLARVAASKLSTSLNQPFYVENHAGAGGIIGSDMVAKAPPDGYTLVASGMASHVITPNTAKVPFDAMKSFTHIAMLGGPPLVLVVHPTLPVKDVKELLAYIAAQPEGINYGSAGAGTHNHLMGELFRSKTNANMVHISYKGGGQALVDLMSGHVKVAFLTLTTVSGNLKAGKLRALAITSNKRLSDYSNVATFSEQGYSYLTTYNWSGLSGPAGMPAPLVEKINEQVNKALRQSDVREKLRTEGIDSFDMDPEAFTAFFQKEIQNWSPVAKSINLKLGN